MKKKLLKKYRLCFAAALFFGAVGALLETVGPQMLGNATTIVFRGIMDKLNGTGRIDFAAVTRILTVLLGLYAVSAACMWLARRMTDRISVNLTHDLRLAAADKLQTISFPWYESMQTGELMARMTDDAEQFGKNYCSSILELVTAVCSVAGICVMMLRISPVMAAIAFVIFPASALVLRMLLRRSQESDHREQEAFGHLQARTEECLGGHQVLKLFGGERAAAYEFAKWNEALYAAEWKSDFYSGAIVQAMSLISNLGYVLTVLAGGYFAAGGALQIGDIQAFLHYIRSFSRPIGRIAQSGRRMQALTAAAKRTEEFLEAPEEAKDSPAEFLEAPGEAEDSPAEASKVPAGTVRFSHVTFGYRADEPPVLCDFTMTVCPGEKVAIVGRTGAGKTTLTKLLLRFYDVSSGAVLVDGKDVRAYDKEKLRSLFGVVPQDTWLLEGTILENIRYGCPDASEEAVRRAAEAANAHSFIEALPDGYHTLLKEGGKSLSRGQRQLLAIARAVLPEPEILILDEATSSVDPETEALITEALQTLMRDRTCFIIAHRASTIRSADRVVSVEAG